MIMSVCSKKSGALCLLVGLTPFLLSACGTQQAAAGPAARTSPTVTRSPAKQTSVKRVVKKNPSPLPLLALAAQIQKTQPVHMNVMITDTLGNAQVHMMSAMDPLNNEAESTDQATMSGISGNNSVTVVA
jgi:hypothetical protein